MANQTVDLIKVFSEVTKTLRANKEALNQADTINRDHGSNMVETFSTITNAMKEKKGSDQSEALAYAATLLSQKAKSGSSHLYSQGLQQAAQQVRGKNIDAQTGMQILQTLLSAGQQTSQTPAANSGAGDLLGSLLGGGQSDGQSGGIGNLLGSLLGASQPATQGAPASGGTDLLGSLLGGLSGTPQSQSSGGGLSDGLDLSDLLTAGMAFMQSKQQGADTMGALVNAFVAASGMGDASHRQQSTQLVANTFLQALGKFAK